MTTYRSALKRCLRNRKRARAKRTFRAGPALTSSNNSLVYRARSKQKKKFLAQILIKWKILPRKWQKVPQPMTKASKATPKART